MRIDPRLIIEFATVAEERSFAKAANRLRMAQPWLSTRIRKLEAHLGFPLFVRTTRRIDLTDKGSEFFGTAKLVGAAMEAANALALRLKGETARLLRVGAAPYTKMIDERRATLEQFAATTPNARIELETGWSLVLLEKLRQGIIDLSFMMGDFDKSEFEGLELRRFGIAITVARSHALAKHDLIVPADLVGKRIQVFTRSLNPALWDALYKPLKCEGIILVEVPEMAEGPPNEMNDDDALAAFFDFDCGPVELPSAMRIPIKASRDVPFSLLRRRGAHNPIGEAFWAAALSSTGWSQNSEIG
ncbi:LysR family transcriptional regulator [Sphingobium sp. CFD-2]|uniref:LysR family transcriptional regulator n=1 Tax=Sphingobium sp. CFD-2 TaxID=2878542 RepID=UPI00214CCC08|nr:LysR family transcriptional regulator [Sphingobium sp. CFD-2]